MLDLLDQSYLTLSREQFLDVVRCLSYRFAHRRQPNGFERWSSECGRVVFELSGKLKCEVLFKQVLLLSSFSSCVAADTRLPLDGCQYRQCGGCTLTTFHRAVQWTLQRSRHHPVSGMELRMLHGLCQRCGPVGVAVALGCDYHT